MNLFSQHIKVKKGEISENIFQDISYREINTNLTKNQTENLLWESFYDVDVIEFKSILNLPNKILYTSNILFLFNRLSIKKFGRLLCLIK